MVSVDDTLPVEMYDTVVEAIRDILSSVQEYKQVCYRSIRRGRPHIPIPEEQLEYLLQMQFSSAELARFFCVSTRTIQRRII